MNPIHTHGFARTCRVATRGFSLIEVLIAVLVLGVGLLGLASVFPVVISQQRDATDVIRGGAAAFAIRGQIESNPDIVNELLSQDGFVDIGEPDSDNDRVPNEAYGSGDNDAAVEGGAEPIFGQDTNYVPGNFGNDGMGRFSPITGYSYLWETDWDWSSNQFVANGPDTVGVGNGEDLLSLYRQDGGVRFRDPLERPGGFSASMNADLPVQARLYPRPYSALQAQQDGPQFVWDFVPRRTPSGDIQIVVFVRRIATGIRVGGGNSLSGILSDTNNMIYPVGWDPSTGLPTNDGTGEYAIPLSARAEPVPASEYPARPEWRDPNNRSEFLLDGIRITVAGDTEVGIAQSFVELTTVGAVGQKFVDNLGVVRTVVEVLAVNDNDEEIDVRVEPPLVPSTIRPSFDQALANDATLAGREAARIGKLRQVVFTPQIPIDVFTMEFSQ